MKGSLIIAKRELQESLHQLIGETMVGGDMVANTMTDSIPYNHLG